MFAFYSIKHYNFYSMLNIVTIIYDYNNVFNRRQNFRGAYVIIILVFVQGYNHTCFEEHDVMKLVHTKTLWQPHESSRASLVFVT